GRAAGAGGGRQGAVGPAPEWRCTVTDYSCTRIAPTGPAGEARHGGGARRGARRGAGAASGESGRQSPPWRSQALIRNCNVYVRPTARANRESQAGAPATGQSQGDAGFMLSTDGSEGNAYTIESLRWSPDSRKIAVFRRRPGYERLVLYVESSPT